MNRVDATVGSPRTVVRLIAIPAILQALLHTAHGFNDFLFIARLDVLAMTEAISACFGILVLIFGIGQIVSIGTHTMAAQLTGAQNYRRRKRMLETAYLLAFCIGLLITMVGLFWTDEFVRILHLPEDAHGYGVRYMRALFIGFPALMMLHVVTGTFRGMGYTMAPVIMEGTVLILNTLLNGIFVLGWLGGPELDVVGAAWATILSCAIITGIAIVVLGRIIRRDAGNQTTPTTPGSRHESMRAILRIGVPASFISIIYGFAFIALNRIASVMDGPAQAAFGASLRGIEWVSWAVCVGFHVAGSVAVGQCIGAGLAARARKVAWSAVIQSVVMVQLVGIAMALTAHWTMPLVVQDPAAQSLGVTYLLWMGFTMFFVGIDTCFEGVLIGTGRSEVPMMISVVMNLLRIPIAATLYFGFPQLGDGILFAVGLTSDIPALADGAAQGFMAIILALVVTNVGKAIWSCLAVYRLDFDEVVKRRAELLRESETSA